MPFGKKNTKEKKSLYASDISHQFSIICSFKHGGGVLHFPQKQNFMLHHLLACHWMRDG